jgi:hypothetical protein
MTSKDKEAKGSQSTSKADDTAQPCSRSHSWSLHKSHSKPGCITRAATPSKSSTNPSTSILEALNNKSCKAKNNPAVGTMEETFASIALRPPSPKVTKFTITEAAIAAAMAELAAAVLKHRADFQILLTSSVVKRTPARENRLRADNVALMTAATIRVQHAGGMRITLERLYKIARQEERAARQHHEKTLTSTPIKINKPKTTMSSIKDAEEFTIVYHLSDSPSLKANSAPMTRDGSQVNLFMEEFQNTGGEDDLKEYSLDPTTQQSMKKAFRGKKTSLVTAALSTTTVVSPARVIIYANIRAALASPAKFITEQQNFKGDHRVAPKISSSAERKQGFNQTMEENKRLREENEAVRKARMAPLEQLVDKEEQRSAAREAASLSQIKAMGDLFYETAQAKVTKEDALKQDKQVQEKVNEEDSDNEGIDPGGIYSGQHEKDDDSSYSVHDSEASDGKGMEELGKGASGCSPLLMGRSKPDDAFEKEPFNWLKEIDSRGTYDKKIFSWSQLTKHSLALVAMIIRTSLILPRGPQHSCASQAQPPGMYLTSILTRLSTI